MHAGRQQAGARKHRWLCSLQLARGPAALSDTRARAPLLALLQVGGVKGGQARGGHSAEPDRAPPPPDVKFGEDNP